MSDREYRAPSTEHRANSPFTMLSTLGWLVAFVWLAILGEWAEIGIGVAATIAMPFLFRIANLPSTGLMSVFDYLVEKEIHVPALALGFFASLFNSLLVMSWCSVVFFHYTDVSCLENLLPLLLWGYGVAMMPLVFMSRFDADNRLTIFFLLIAHILYVALVASFAMGASTEVAVGFVLLSALIMPCVGLFAGMATLSRRVVW
ncbi:MAG: hypothetical protein HY017_15295 [Betaproteobacteria bacterium]|nr:hypothetical protein [Betaproteobacteria bacterium]